MHTRRFVVYRQARGVLSQKQEARHNGKKPVILRRVESPSSPKNIGQARPISAATLD
jgi:hypothetical protein